jgi:hypothetical protein
MFAQTAILVGPSPHLEGMGLGKSIDNMGYVARMNNSFEIQNFKDYGHRTDFLFVNKQWQENNRDRIREVQYRFGVQNVFLKGRTMTSQYIRPDGFEFSGTKPNMGVYVAINLWLTGFSKVFVTGFSFYQNHPFYVKEHYENQEGMILEGESHPQSDTVKDFQKLIDLGIVVLWPDTLDFFNKAKEKYNI